MADVVGGSVIWNLDVDDSKFASGLSNAQSKIDDVAARGQRTFSSMAQNISRSFDNISQSLDRTGDRFIRFGAPAAAGLAAAGFAVLSFEDNLANVRKSVGLTAEETRAFGDEILKLAPATRTSVNSLIDIAKVGGQIGIGKDQIVGFTDSINKLAVALGDEFLGGAEQVTQEVGVLRQLFADIKSDDPSQDLLRIGNALNVLGAEGLATGPIVADFSTRIAGLTGGLGVSSGDILGLSASLQELGVNAERGGSNVGRIMNIIAKDSAGIAKSLGLNVKDFTDLVNKDLNKAFLTVATRVREVGTENTKFSQMLDEIGLDAVGASEVLRKVGGNIELVQNKQSTANKALQGTSSILDEYNIKNETGAAQVAKFTNRITTLGVSLQDGILPALNRLIDVVGPVLEGFAKFASANPELVTNVLLLGTAITGLGLAFKVAASAFSVFSSVASAIGWIATMNTKLGVTAMAVKGVGMAFAFLAANPIVLIIGAIVGAVILLATAWNNNWFDIQGKTKAALDFIGAVFQDFVNWLTITLPKAVSDFVGATINFFIGLPEAIVNIIGAVINGIAYGLGFMLAMVIVGVPKVVEAIFGFFASLPDRIGGIFNSIKAWVVNTLISIGTWVATEVPVIIANMVGFFASLPGKIGAALSNIGVAMNNFKDNVVNGARNTWTALVAEVSSWPSRIYEWGKNVVTAFANGIKDAINSVVNAFKKGMDDAKKFIQGKSPPIAGPFKDIDKWGFNIGEAWVGGIRNAVADLSLPTIPMGGVSGAASSDMFSLGQPEMSSGGTKAAGNVTMGDVYIKHESDIPALGRELGFRMALVK